MPRNATFSVRVANAEQVVVAIDASRVPLRFNDDGEAEPDYGNADWPLDADIARIASRLFGRAVKVRFFDACDGRLDEAIYDVVVPSEAV
ncbi:MAG: hypothetical protein Q8S13_08310 [Dehalococcoidia bacterium]|nr:hypothetical protein [Dehalococcoidia bacterium]